MYKKIALGLTTLAAAGLLMTGCAREGDTKLRKYMYEQLGKVPENSITLNVGKYNDKKLTVEKGYNYLGVKIENKRTGNVLKIIDNGIKWTDGWAWPLPADGCFSGVDKVTYNDFKNGKEGMDERFDEALRKVKPALEMLIKDNIEETKRNTTLK